MACHSEDSVEDMELSRGYWIVHHTLSDPMRELAGALVAGAMDDSAGMAGGCAVVRVAHSDQEERSCQAAHSSQAEHDDSSGLVAESSSLCAAADVVSL